MKKFRQWDEINNEMSYDANPAFDVGPFCIMECIGIKDKNGNDIYECDILEITSLCAPDSYGVVKPAKWYEDNERCLHYGYDVFMQSNFGESDMYGYKIVGNIFEDPDLIEKMKKL